MGRDRLSRREFLKQGSLALGALTAGTPGNPSPGATATKTAQVDLSHNYNPQMGYRRLGKTNIIISEIGLGGHGPSELKNREEVLAHAAELGMNYLDTNMVSECELYGQALRGMRDKWHIGFACWPFKLTEPENVTAEVMMRNLEGALKNYHTDMLDIWRPVGAAFQEDTTALLENRVLDKVVEVFEKAKVQGKVRYLGISVHNPMNIRHVLNNYASFSVVLFPYFFLTREKLGESLVCLAKEKDMGIIAIKPFGGGLMFRAHKGWAYGAPERDAAILLTKILANRGISSTIPGVASRIQLDVNVRASYDRRDRLTSLELETLTRWEKRFFANLPAEYAWFRQWEYV